MVKRVAVGSTSSKILGRQWRDDMWGTGECGRPGEIQIFDESELGRIGFSDRIFGSDLRIGSDRITSDRSMAAW